MAKCTRETHPTLFAYMEAYGIDQQWVDKVDRIKENGHYAVVGYPVGDGTRFDIMDLSKSPDPYGGCSGKDLSEYGWNFLNDGGEGNLTEKEWNAIRLDPNCDGFTIPGHPQFGDG